mmetsp:Transcript_9952/g.21251  ORF Transcript_9952/g.21251 Transcript_9952/m.21251 type:complete len:238 (+) Transcript_9952:595-1308(+)
MMLLTTLTAWPEPRGPTCRTLPEKASTHGFTRSTTSGSPPIMLVTVPASAPRGPPLTGQSTMCSPFSASLAPMRWVWVGSPEVQSTNTAPGVKTLESSSANQPTSLEVGKQVSTTSHPLRSSRLVAGSAEHCRASNRAVSAVRFHSSAVLPAAWAAAATCLPMGPPMAPSPAKATRVPAGAFLATGAGAARPAALAARAVLRMAFSACGDSDGRRPEISRASSADDAMASCCGVPKS